MALVVITEGDRRHPVLVLLHGFMGRGADWRSTVSRLKTQFYCVCLDLPGHGVAAKGLDNFGKGFDDCCAQIDATLKALGVTTFWLSGYSLGGRIAMHYVCRYLPERIKANEHAILEPVLGLILESAHPGMKTMAQRQARRQNDHRWAMRLRSELLATVLNDWYQQPVFADLASVERQAMVARRLTNDGTALADMLEATSLSLQAYLGDALYGLTIPVLYLCGARDHKFHAIGQQLGECPNIVLAVKEQAGHNVHAACPAFYADTILSFYASHHDTTEFDDE